MQKKDKQAEKLIRMTQMPIPRLVCTLAIPTIISMMVTAIYNMADTFFVSRLGTSATGAVGVVFSLMAVIQAIGFTLGQGSGNYISRKLGSGETKDAEKMAAAGFIWALLLGTIFMVLGLVFLDPLMRCLGSTETILPYARDYARYILLGTPYMVASLVLNNQLRYQGNAVYAMVGITAGGILNIGLDPLFIFVFGMGTGGAALATVISQFIGFCILLVGCEMGGNIRIRPRNFSLKWELLYEILHGGLPSFWRQGMGSLSTICLNLAAGPYGDAAIAAMSIVSRVNAFAGAAMIGFGQGFQPVCGFNYGAKLYHRVRQAFWFCVKVSIAALMIVAVVGWIYSPQVVALFRAEDLYVMEMGTLAMRLQCVTLPLIAWITICNMLLQTIGKSARASLLAMARQGLFFLPAILILPRCIGFLGVQLSQPIADVCAFLLAMPLVLGVLREMREAQEMEEDGRR